VRLGLELPDEPAPVRFLNTIWADRSGIHDDLASPGHARQWLSRVPGLTIEKITTHDLDELRTMRDCLRRIAAHITGDERTSTTPPPLPDALDRLNRWAAEPLPHPGIDMNDRHLTRRHPETMSITAATAHLAREGIDFLTDDDHHHPLRPCNAPGCPLFYVLDHPRRAWCSPGCGNRARAARHYARHRPHRTNPTA
jgi:predicted RNA-binding Zn ribbon-like protein